MIRQKHQWLLQLALDSLALGSLRGSTLALLTNSFPLLTLPITQSSLLRAWSPNHGDKTLTTLQAVLKRMHIRCVKKTSISNSFWKTIQWRIGWVPSFFPTFVLAIVGCVCYGVNVIPAFTREVHVCGAHHAKDTLPRLQLYCWQSPAKGLLLLASGKLSSRSKVWLHWTTWSNANPSLFSIETSSVENWIIPAAWGYHPSQIPHTESSWCYVPSPASPLSQW